MVKKPQGDWVEGGLLMGWWLFQAIEHHTFVLIDCYDPAYLDTDGHYNAISSTYTNRLKYSNNGMVSCMGSPELSEVISASMSNLALSVW